MNETLFDFILEKENEQFEGEEYLLKVNNTIYDFLEAHPVFCALALTSQEYIWADLKNEYQKIHNAYDYYHKNKDEGMERTIAAHLTQRQEPLVQAVALYYYCGEQRNYGVLLRLFKKAYKKLSKTIERSPERIASYDMSLVIMRLYPEKNSSPMTYFYLDIVCLYIAEWTGKKYILCDMHLLNWLMQTAALFELKVDTLDAGRDSKHVDRVVELFRLQGVNPDYSTAEMIFSKYLHTRFKDFAVLNPSIDNFARTIQDLRENDKMLSLQGFMCLVLSANGLNPFEFTTQQLEPMQAEKMLYHVATYFGTGEDHEAIENMVASGELIPYVPVALILDSVVKAYKRASRTVLNLGTEEAYAHAKAIEELNNQMSKLLLDKDQEIATLKQHHSRQLSELSQDNKVLEKKVSELTGQLDREQKEKLELHALRELVYVRERIENSDTQLNHEQITTHINAAGVTIIGGNPKWQKKLQQVLPKCHFINFDQSIKQLQNLKNKECVFLNVTYFNHPTFYKLIGSLRANNMTTHFLSGYANIDRTLEEIYHQLN